MAMEIVKTLAKSRIECPMKRDAGNSEDFPLVASATIDYINTLDINLYSIALLNVVYNAIRYIIK